MQKEQDKLKSREDDFNSLVAIYGMQAVMQLAHGREEVFFYKIKLNVFNFTIYNLNFKQGAYAYIHTYS